MGSLRLSFYPEGDHHINGDHDGELSATVAVGEFRARGSAWFSTQQLRDFCHKAGAYPIPEGQEPNLAGGFWNDSGDTLEQVHLGVQLSPYGRLGSILVTVTLATPSEGADLQQTLTARFRAGYGDVDRFRVAFVAMLQGQADKAVLEGTPN